MNWRHYDPDRTLARLDEDMARYGDLDAQKRILQRREVILQQQRIQRLEQQEAAAPEAAREAAPAMRGQGGWIALPKKKPGPRTGKGEGVTQRMLTDIQGGKHTVGDLVTMPQKILAAEYGVSRDTACKALARAVGIVGIPNSGK